MAEGRMDGMDFAGVGCNQKRDTNFANWHELEPFFEICENSMCYKNFRKEAKLYGEAVQPYSMTSFRKTATSFPQMSHD